MRNHARPLGTRIGRAVIIGLGALGALAALDASALFLFLLFAAAFVAPSGPYIGLILFVVVPLTVVVGGALAWAGYYVLTEQPEEPVPADGAVDAPGADGRHAHA